MSDVETSTPKPKPTPKAKPKPKACPSCAKLRAQIDKMQTEMDGSIAEKEGLRPKYFVP
jgi:hypothetical protein